MAAIGSLEEISIVNSEITGVGFRAFNNSKVRILKLNHCKISPAGLKCLGGLGWVEELSLFCCDITDVGLESLAEMTVLQSLNLYWNPVTIAGLRKLIPSKSLRSVDVAQCKISKSECRKFNRESGGCRAFTYDD